MSVTTLPIAKLIRNTTVQRLENFRRFAGQRTNPMPARLSPPVVFIHAGTLLAAVMVLFGAVVAMTAVTVEVCAPAGIMFAGLTVQWLPMARLSR
jgi:hypothetical protein